MNTVPSTAARTPRRLLLLILLLLGVLGLCWWGGVLAWWPRSQARAALEVGHLDEAETWLRRAVRLAPADEHSQFLLARVQRKQGDLARFERSLQRAVGLGLDADLAQKERILAQAQAGGVGAVGRQLDQMLIQGGIDGGEVLEAYINGCLKEARLKQAAALIEGWMQTTPDDPRPYYFAGRLQLHYGNSEKAQESFGQALAREPELHAAAYLVGQILLQQNRPEEALQQFSQAGRMTYNSAPLVGRARALRSLGRVDEARQVLEEVVARPEHDVRTSFQRVGDRYEGAVAAFELGSLESAVGNHESALKWLDVAVEANPRDLSARHARGIALRSVGRSGEAAAELEAVREARLALREVDRLADLIDRNPQLVDERVRIGELYLRHESLLTAEFWLKSALTLRPDSPRAHARLAELYEQRAGENAAYQALAEQHRREAGAAAEDPAAAPESAGDADPTGEVSAHQRE
jgi:tetratricopeptide (TPR) repeat protein